MSIRFWCASCSGPVGGAFEISVMSVIASVFVARGGDWRSGAHFSVPAWQSAHMNILRYRISLRSLYCTNVPCDSIFAHRVGLSKEWQRNVSVALSPAVTSAPSSAIDFPVTSAPFTFVSWCPRASPCTSAMLLLRTDAIKNSPFAGSIVSSAPSGLCGRWISTVFNGATLARLCVAIELMLRRHSSSHVRLQWSLSITETEVKHK